jgi:hypothetical protein
MSDDATLARIGEGRHHRGRRAAAPELFTRLWAEIGGDRGDPLHVCVLAHAMADVQEDVHEELVWDLRALAAAGLLTTPGSRAGVPLPVAALYPSLHLNLSDCYRKLGDPTRARAHLEQAREGIGALGDDDYGRLIRSGLDRLAQLLAAE